MMTTPQPDDDLPLVVLDDEDLSVLPTADVPDAPMQAAVPSAVEVPAQPVVNVEPASAAPLSTVPPSSASSSSSALPLLLTRLVTFGQGRLATGAGNAVLEALDVAQPRLVNGLRLGFIPADYQQALSTADRRLVAGQRLGQSLIVPATDEQGFIVDLVIVRAGMTGSRQAGWFKEPRGLVGATLIEGADTLILTDTLRAVGRLHRQGYQHATLIRGPLDAVHNAQRFVAAGISNVLVRTRKDGPAIAQALAAAGLRVAIDRRAVSADDELSEPPTTLLRTAFSPVPVPSGLPAAPRPVAAPVPVARASEPVQTVTVDANEPLRFPQPAPAAPAASVLAPTTPAPAVATEPAVAAPISEGGTDLNTLTPAGMSTDGGTAFFEVGPVRYAFETGEDLPPTRLVVVRRAQAVHRDRFNLDVERQRLAFASSAGQRLGIDTERVRRHLTEAWRQLRVMETAAAVPPAPVMAAADQVEGEALARDPHLLQRAIADIGALGWIGDDRAKGLGFLAATSRLLSEPVWTVFRATLGDEPWRNLGVIASLMPPESVIIFRRLTESLLRQADQQGLRHRLLLVDRAETLRPEGAIALRCLRAWGSVGWSQVAQAEGGTGGLGSGLVGEVRGPVAVIAAAAGDLDHRCRDAFITVTADESPSATAAILAAQRRQHGQPLIASAAAQAIQRRHHALQRLLRPASVVIPFADRIAFPMTSVRHRVEQAAFLALIAASAVLHQFQRSRDADGAVIADEADFAHARMVSADLLGVGADGLSPAGRRLLRCLTGAGIASCALADLAGLIPDWTAYTFRAAAEELVTMGYASAAGGGQGRRRTYTLTLPTGATVDPIRLLPVGSGVAVGVPEAPAEPSSGEMIRHA